MNPPEIGEVAHLHDDPELDEEIERPSFNKAWLTEYRSGKYTHPSTLWQNWLARRAKGVETMLDIGGGNGILSMPYWESNKVQLLDVAPHEGHFKHLKRVIVGDCETALDVFGEKSFDVIQFTEIIEHLRKVKGRRMLEMLPKLAKRAIIITTPGGFSRQPKTFENPYNVHISGWTPMEFEEAGYEVYMNASQIIATMWL